MIAHIAGVPMEEALLPLASSLGAALLPARAWVRRSGVATTPRFRRERRTVR